ncbi:MAG: phosphoribosyltransferase family protein, partial [Anaerolineae bacterium]
HGIAAHRPKSLTDLLTVRGVGPAKVEKYGAEVLALVAEAGHHPVAIQPTNEPSHDPIAAFLSRPHPRPLKGPWLAGWALDFHSRFDGDEQIRSAVGELAFRYKYNGERHLAHDLAARWVELLAAHSELPKPDVVIPIPPSIRRDFDPVALLAQALAEKLGVPTIIDALVKTRATRPQKEMTALAQKQANVAGAFALKGEVRGKRLILVDDLYDSGATLAEAARALTRGGAASLVVLTLTKTIHADA